MQKYAKLKNRYLRSVFALLVRSGIETKVKKIIFFILFKVFKTVLITTALSIHALPPANRFQTIYVFLPKYLEILDFLWRLNTYVYVCIYVCTSLKCFGFFIYIYIHICILVYVYIYLLYLLLLLLLFLVLLLFYYYIFTYILIYLCTNMNIYVYNKCMRL